MIWLFGDWYHLLGAPWAQVALVVCAILCGTLIGAEREKNFKPAGLRTMILIALGSALFTMLSFLLAGDDGDRGRVAAIGLTGAVLLLLILLTQVENRYLGPCYYASVTLIYDDDSGKTGVKVDSVLEDYRIPPSSISKALKENGRVELTLNYCNAHKHHKAFLMKFSEMPEIKSISRND